MAWGAQAGLQHSRAFWAMSAPLVGKASQDFTSASFGGEKKENMQGTWIAQEPVELM